MLKVPSIRQKPSFCGPAALAMVFGYYGLRVSQKRIAIAAGSTFELGTSGQQMLKAARAFGFKARMIDGATMDMLIGNFQKGIPTIVNWFCVDDGHYSVVVNIDNKHITLRDPEQKRHNKLDRDAFERCWFDFKAGVPASPKTLDLKRMIVIEKK